MGSRSGRSGFTLLEIVVVLVVVAILATLTIPVFSKLRERAQRAQCAANLRNLYLAADLYVQQKESWPQIRLENMDESALRLYADAWVAALEPFGATRKTWICPTIQDSESEDYNQPGNARIDYWPTPFDDKPVTPHKWSRMPWFSEQGDAHGGGNLIVFADGSISDLKTVAAKAK